MMHENEAAPEDERLANHEFDLEADERKQLQEKCETEVQKVAIILGRFADHLKHFVFVLFVLGCDEHGSICQLRFGDITRPVVADDPSGVKNFLHWRANILELD